MGTRRCSSAVWLMPAVMLAACGGTGDGDARPPVGSTAVVYSSLPLRGEHSEEAVAASNGIRLALDQAGGRAGKLRVRYRSLDDTGPKTGLLSHEAAVNNARRVARDNSAVAYIGEFGEGSALSIPVTNEGGVAQIGIADTWVGLTTEEAGAATGEPEKHYPSTNRTFVRVVPRDTIQGAALVTLAKQSGCTRLAVANDGTRVGIGLARGLQAAAAGSQRLEIALDVTIDPQKTDYRSQAREARLRGADCFAFAGVPANAATRAYEDFGAALADADLFGPDRLAAASFTDPDKGGVSASLGRRIRLTVSTLPPDYPRGAQRFARQYERAYGAKPLPSALYGYEAMGLVLDAIRRSGDGARADVIRKLLETNDRKSLLGPYSIDPNGDTTLADYGVCTIVDGRLDVERTIRAEVAE